MDTQLDWLTGFHYKDAMHIAGERLLAEAQASNSLLGIIHIDIDGMKPFNDINSLPAGDRLIVGIAKVIQAHIPNGTAVGRVGGDEFLIIMPTTSEGKTEALAEAIRVEAKTVIVMGGAKDNSWQANPVTLTIGLSCYPRHGENLKTLWVAAEDATHAGKHSGRDRVCWPDAG